KSALGHAVEMTMQPRASQADGVVASALVLAGTLLRVVRLHMDILLVAGLNVAGIALSGQFAGADAQPLFAPPACGDFIGFQGLFPIGHDVLLTLRQQPAASTPGSCAPPRLNLCRS